MIIFNSNVKKKDYDPIKKNYDLETLKSVSFFLPNVITNQKRKEKAKRKRKKSEIERLIKSILCVKKHSFIFKKFFLIKLISGQLELALKQ